MQLIKEVKIKHSFGLILSQIIPLALVIWVIPLDYLFNNYFTLPTLLLTFMLRYPHEYIHKKTGDLIGFDSSINFKRLNATCTPNRMTEWWEEMIFSIAPLIVQTIVLQFILVALNGNVSNYIYYMTLSIFILSFTTYIGDIMFIINTFKYKGYLFEDTGMGLNIYKK